MKSRIFAAVTAAFVLASGLPAYADDTNPLVPFPSPLTAASGGGGGGGGNVSGTCATTNAIAVFSAASTLTCFSTLKFDGTTLTLPATWSAPADVAFALGGGVNGINFDSNTLSIDATNNRVGFGTAAPTATVQITGNATDTALNIVGGTLGAGVPVATLTATFPVSVASQTGITPTFTTQNSSGLGGNTGMDLAMGGPYTGASRVVGIEVEDFAAGTGTADPRSINFQQANIEFNAAIWGITYSATTGYNFGVLGIGTRSTALNIGIAGVISYGSLLPGNGSLDIGVSGSSVIAGTNTINVGVEGHALNGGTSNVGGYFGLNVAAVGVSPTYTTAALIADNDAIASPIVIFRDNGTAVYVLQDGGLPDSRNVSATSDAATGSCSAVTVSGNNVRGTITATCLAGQTVVMNFGTPNWPAAPICVFGAGGEQTATSTSSTTVKGDVALTGGKMTYYCTD